MVKRTQTRIVDDLEYAQGADKPHEAVRRHILALDGQTVILELGEKNSRELTDHWGTLISAGTPVDQINLVREWLCRCVDPMVIRTWAQKNDIPCGDRGRIPADVITAFMEQAEEGETNIGPISQE